MENTALLDDERDDFGDLGFTTFSRETFKVLVRWTWLFSILQYLALLYFVYQFFLLIVESQKKNFQMGVGFGYLILIVFLFFSAFHLWGFSRRASLSLQTKNNKIFSVSIDSLKSFFRYFCIVLVAAAIIIINYLYVFWTDLRYMEIL